MIVFEKSVRVAKICENDKSAWNCACVRVSVSQWWAVKLQKNLENKNIPKLFFIHNGVWKYKTLDESIVDDIRFERLCRIVFHARPSAIQKFSQRKYPRFHSSHCELWLVLSYLGVREFTKLFASLRRWRIAVHHYQKCPVMLLWFFPCKSPWQYEPVS